MQLFTEHDQKVILYLQGAKPLTLDYAVVTNITFDEHVGMARGRMLMEPFGNIEILEIDEQVWTNSPDHQ